jgi:hypothetical protein
VASASSVARAPLVCKEFSANRYGPVNAGSLARPPKSSRFLTKASVSARCWAAMRCSVSASGSASSMVNHGVGKSDVAFHPFA